VAVYFAQVYANRGRPWKPHVHGHFRSKSRSWLRQAPWLLAGPSTSAVGLSKIRNPLRILLSLSRQITRLDQSLLRQHILLLLGPAITAGYL